MCEYPIIYYDGGKIYTHILVTCYFGLKMAKYVYSARMNVVKGAWKVLGINCAMCFPQRFLVLTGLTARFSWSVHCDFDGFAVSCYLRRRRRDGDGQRKTLACNIKQIF
jgi:hypothetical protein